MPNEQTAAEAELKALEADLESEGGPGLYEITTPKRAEPQTPHDDDPPPADETAKPPESPKADKPKDAQPVKEGEDDPRPRNWKEANALIREKKNQLKELQARMAELEAKVSKTPAAHPETPVAAQPPASRETPPEARQTEPKVSAEQVFDLFAKAKDQEFPTPEKNREVMELAVKAVGEMSTREIQGVVEAARQGRFGERSEVVAEIARASLVEALAREKIGAEDDGATQAKAQEFSAKVQDSVRKVMEDPQYAPLKDTGSEETKFLAAWVRENMGERDATGRIVKPGPFAFLESRPDWPEHVVRIAMQAYRANRAADVEKANAELKAKIEASRAPGGTGGGAGAEGATGGDTAELKALERELASAGNIGYGG